MKRENLENAVNDASRHVTRRGKHVIVPLKFDAQGQPATPEKLLFKHLTLSDLRFLQVWRDSAWDVAKATEASGLAAEKVERLVRKLACFRAEDAKVRALCEIPTPAWITAKHVENVYEGGRLEDSEHKSLAELAKIQGAYKQQTQTQVNIFNLPKLTPETEAKLKQLAEQAIDTEQVA